MKHGITIKIVGFIALVLYISMMPQILRPALGKGVKTSYKRYSIFNYKNEDFLCEPYTVNQDDWLYKIFRKKGEISEKDFPHFLIIFKEINPEISNIDAIEPGFHILIPLKKVEKGDYDQITPGTVDVPVIEFSTMKEDLDLKPFLRQHTIKKGDNVSSLIDKDFLAKGGGLSEEGLKAFQLANPNVKNIDIVYEGTDIYLPDPAIKSQPWFQSFLSGNAAPEPETGEKDKELKQSKLEAYKLTQLKKYSSLIGGTLLSHGKMYFPAAPGRTMPGKPDHDQVLDLSSAPIIETDDGTKILIISGENVNDELLKSVQTYWRGLKIQLMSEAVDTLKSAAQTKASALGNITREYKQIIETLLAQTDYDYVPDVKIPFTLNNITLEAAFGRVIREDTTDLLINFGNVYGAALEVLEKREFEIMSIPPRIAVPELIKQLFARLGYATWNNPSFSTGDTVETLNGLYASRETDKLFVPNEALSQTARLYLKKENIKILSLNEKRLSQ
jgi:hypothetical protein